MNGINNVNFNLIALPAFLVGSIQDRKNKVLFGKHLLNICSKHVFDWVMKTSETRVIYL